MAPPRPWPTQIESSVEINDCFGEGKNVVFESIGCWFFAFAESGEVRCNDPKAARELAAHASPRRAVEEEPVQEDDRFPLPTLANA